MRQALEMALEAFEEIAWSNSTDWQRDRAKVAITAIKEELAQQETPYKIGQRIAKTGGGISHLWSAVSQDGEIAEAERGFKEALAQPVVNQSLTTEPVAWMEKDVLPLTHIIKAIVRREKDETYTEPLYTTPPQRKPLTDGQIWDLHIKMSVALDCKLSDLIEMTRAIEAAHEIKE